MSITSVSAAAVAVRPAPVVSRAPSAPVKAAAPAAPAPKAADTDGDSDGSSRINVKA